MNELETLSKCIDADRLAADELHHEIDRRVRNRLVEESTPGPIRMAMLSCVTGRWDDLAKDVQRKRITKEQAIDIIEKIRYARLIGDNLAEAMRARIGA
jgi:hypothetical protein